MTHCWQTGIAGQGSVEKNVEDAGKESFTGIPPSTERGLPVKTY